MSVAAHALLDALDAIETCVDAAAWDDAQAAMARYDKLVRNAFGAQHGLDRETWQELVRRQQILTFKFAALRGDAALQLETMRRDHGAARRYLSP
ncbi:MAG TPA: hypothetical protein VF132_00840 [Rudaea sp.]